MAFDWQTLVSGLSSLFEQDQKNRANARAQQDLLAGQNAARLQQQKANTAIGDVVQQQAASNPAIPQAKSLAAFTTALRNARTAPAASMPAVGGERYQAAVTNANQRTAQYGAGQAFDLSQIAGAERQREGEGIARADLGSNLQTIAGRGDMDLYLAKLKAAREQPNPWVTMLAQLGQRIGRNYVPRNQRLNRLYAPVQATPSIAGEWSDVLPTADAEVA